MSQKGAHVVGQMDVSGTQTYVERQEDIRTYIAGAAITALDWVQLDYANQSAIGDADVVIQAAVVSTGQPAAIGVALDAATAAGDRIRVQVAGYIAACNHSASAGESLVAAGTTAGRAEAYAASDLAPIVGFATANSSSNSGPAYIFRRI